MAALAGLLPLAAHAVDVQIASFTDTPNPATRGGPITFTFTVQNNDSDTANNVVATYALPANTQFISAADTASGTACAFDGGTPGTVTCTYPTLVGTLNPTPGPVRTVNVVLKTLPAAPATITSTVNATSSDVDVNPANNSLTVTTTINNGADLSATLSGSPSPVIGGGYVTWTVSGGNAGPNASGPVTFTSTLPGTLTYVSSGSGGSGWSCSASGQVVTCTAAAMASGTTYSFPIVTQLTGVASGTVTVSGSVGSTVADPDPTNNSAVASVSVNSGADLSITQNNPTPNPVTSGSAVTWVLNPSNLGPYPANTGVKVTFTLPAGFSVTSNTGSTGWSCSNAGSPAVVTCSYASSYASGAAGAITVVATAPTVSATTNFANIGATIAANAGGPADPNSSNNSAYSSVTVSPDGVDLSITKSKSPYLNALGTNLTSEIYVANNGPRVAAAGTITVVDTIDTTHEQYLGFTGTNWNCASAGSTITCTYTAALAAGATSPALDLTTRSVAIGSSTNTAVVSYSSTPGDYDLSNNTASATSQITATSNSPNLSATLTATTAGGVPTTVEYNESQVVYTLVGTNGLSTAVDAKDILAFITIPYRLAASTVTAAIAITNTSGASNATFSCTGTGTGSTANEVDCTQAAGTVLKPGDKVTLTVTVTRPMQDGPSTVVVGGFTSHTQGDPDYSDNYPTTSVAVDPIADVELVSNVLAANPVLAGTPATFTATIRNDGPSAAANPAMSYAFAIPAGDSGFTYQSVSVSGGGSCTGMTAGTSYASGTKTLNCTWPSSLANGSSQTVTVNLMPNWQAGTAVRTLPSTATVSTTTPEDTSNGQGAAPDSKAVTLTINPAQVDMLITNDDTPDPLSYDPATLSNNDVTYAVGSINNGPSLATGTGFTFTMTPPAGKTITFRGDSGASNAATTYPSGTITGGYCNSVGNAVTGPATMTITCTFPSGGQIANGGSVNRYLVFRIGSPPTPAGDTYNSNATVIVNETDTNLANNQAGQTTTVRVRKPSLSGYVYLDANANNVRDGGDTAISGATVRLLNASTLAVVATTTTDSTGAYTFTGIDPFTIYTLEVPLPSSPASLVEAAINPGLIGGAACAGGCTAQPNTPSAGSGRIATIDLSSGNNGTAFNFGMIQQVNVTGLVYLDANRNGTLDASDTGRLGGVTVKLEQGANCASGTTVATTTTAADGTYGFVGVATNQNYLICQTPSPLYGSEVSNPGPNAASTNPTTITITALTASGSANNNFGQTFASIAGSVYQDNGPGADYNNGARDPGEAGLANVPVTLTGTNAGGAAVNLSTTTDASGNYVFDGLLAANASGYTVAKGAIPAADGTFVDGKDTAGTAGGSTATQNVLSAIPLGAGVQATGYLFGELPIAPISGTVYTDLNRDNLMQASPADGRVAGATVTLYGGASCSGTVLATATTDPSGNYSFSGEAAGQTYTVCSATPAGYGAGVANPGTNGASTGTTAITITALPTTGSAGNNFGLRVGTISGLVYLDANNDGVHQTTETGLAGVTITLSGTDAAGAAVNRTTTSATDGSFSFGSVLASGAGGYTLTEQTAQPLSAGVATLNGKTTAGSAGGTATGPTVSPSAVSAISLAAGSDSTNNLFGEILPSTLSGVVFQDVNNNGVQDLPGDAGLPGVAINLTGTDDTGNAVSRSTTTAADGSYSFAALRPGSYTVSEPAQPAGTSNGKTIAGSAGGTATAVTVTPSAISLIPLSLPGTVATGYNFAEIPSNSSIAGKVWIDANNNGVIDAGELGIAGVTINLSGTDASGSAVNRTTTTDATGAYSFAGLAPGSYALAEPTQPTGTLNGRTVAGSSGGTASAVAVTPSTITAITLGVGQSSTGNNFGELAAGQITGRVYLDNNNNGVVDAGEAGIPGVAVNLTGTDDQGNAVSSSTVSASDGTYTFGALRPGVYAVTEPAQPAGTDNGITTAGSLGGTATSPSVTPSAISAITLPPGGQASGYNFGEIGASPALMVTKDHLPAQFTVNNPGTYRIRVRNGGDRSTSGSYTVTDYLPAGLTLAATPTGTSWACVGAAGATSFTCTSSVVIGTGVTSSNEIDVAVSVGTIAAANSPVYNAVLVDGGGQVAARSPSAASVAAAQSNPSALPQCDSTISVNACHDQTIVRQAASLAGTVWFDVGTASGVLDAGDVRLPNWKVQVLDAGGALVASATTAADGSYRIGNLVPGVPLTVRFIDPASGVVFAYPVNGETAQGSSGATCNQAAAIAGGTESSCVSRGSQPQLTVVLAPGMNLAQQSLPVDPSGVVYDSTTRQPVAGAVVTLTPVGSCSGWAPASSIVGATLGGYTISGGSISMTVGASGLYQFLLGSTAPTSCEFSLSVTPPSTYTFQSTVIPAATGVLAPTGAVGGSYDVQPQAGPPTGSVGQATTYYLALMAGSGLPSVLHNHIPLDPALPTGISLSKTGDKTVAEIGDTVRYSITVHVSAGSYPRQVTVVDRLPAGFTYIKGTAMVNGVSIPDPTGNLGPQLAFNLGAMPSTGTELLQYRVRIGVGSAQGDGINHAQGFACAVASGCTTPGGFGQLAGSVATNQAQFAVKVTGGVFAPEACVVGKIFVDCNGNQIQDPEELGIPGVRLVIQDGTTLVSDSEGKYAYCGLSPRSAVIKVDPTTLPRGSRLVNSSNRNMGDANSLWLDLKNGELHRADFIEGSCSNPVLEQVKARRAQGEVRAPETEKGHPALRFDSKADGLTPATSPQEGTDSANQPVPKPRDPPIPIGPSPAASQNNNQSNGGSNAAR